MEPEITPSIHPVRVRLAYQPIVLFSRNKLATNNQSAVLFSQNKSAPATSQTNKLVVSQLLASSPRLFFGLFGPNHYNFAELEKRHYYYSSYWKFATAILHFTHLYPFLHLTGTRAHLQALYLRAGTKLPSVQARVGPFLCSSAVSLTRAQRPPRLRQSTPPATEIAWHGRRSSPRDHAELADRGRSMDRGGGVREHLVGQPL
jgi:hypothetical protein